MVQCVEVIAVRAEILGKHAVDFSHGLMVSRKDCLKKISNNLRNGAAVLSRCAWFSTRLSIMGRNLHL